MRLFKKPIHARRHVKPDENLYRLTWDCNSDTGQCGFVIMVSKDERDWLISQDLVYQNHDGQDDDHRYSFADDLHPLWDKVNGWQVVRRLEAYRQKQPYPKNLGPAF